MNDFEKSLLHVVLISALVQMAEGEDINGEETIQALIELGFEPNEIADLTVIELIHKLATSFSKVELTDEILSNFKGYGDGALIE